MSKKKLALIVLTLLLVIFLVPGCGKKKDNSNEKNDTEESVVLPDADLDDATNTLPDDTSSATQQMEEPVENQNQTPNQEQTEDSAGEETTKPPVQDGTIELPFDEW